MKTVELSSDDWVEILNAAQNYRDEGPDDEGWQSQELKLAAERLAAQLKEAE